MSAAHRSPRRGRAWSVWPALALVLGVTGCASGPAALPPPAVPDAPADAAPAGPRVLDRGIGSWYGEGFAGRRTASGEAFDPNALTAAHRSLPFGTRVRVRHEATGQEVVVRINDRGPHIGGRVIDLSRAAAARIGLLRAGVGPVVLFSE